MGKKQGLTAGIDVIKSETAEIKLASF